MNEYTTIMNDVESDFLLDVQTLLGKGELNPEAKALLPVWIDSLMYKSLKFNEFGLRLPNVIVLLLTFFGFYYFGKKIFGLKNTVVTLLVLGSSFLPVNLAKFATGDVWLFGVQLMSFVLMILYLKQPIGKWKWGVWFFVVLGAMIHPLSMLIWSMGLWGYLQIFHPKGKTLEGLVLLPLFAIVYLPMWYFGFISLEMPHFLMGIGSEHFKYLFVFALIAVLPWFGFLPASLWDMIQKLRKKEELAIINLGWILFAIFSQSMIIVAAFSFLIAKNLIAYFDKNYPYRRWVKGFTLLNMIFTFFMLFMVLLGGFLNFQGEGYRSVFGLSILYWFGSMAAVLGLFMHKNSLVTGGMAVSGLMFTWLFWLQVNPLMESQRNFPKQVFQELKTQ
jgi:4-amino-4-deoxy-L-arabinose transferase-like glycosyltransferase